MQRLMRSQRGAYLVIVSLLLVVLIGFGALALDLGRLFVLRSEMQNAADAAALAAAMELGREAGAQGRAILAARDVLEYDSKFASVRELLGTNISLDFFCAIGSELDPDDISGFCANGYDPDGRAPAANEVESHYVRVNLAPAEDSEAYSIPLFFLPVLNLLGGDVASRSFLATSAIAGRNFYQCDYPPAMICNPFEPADFRASMDPGDQITLNRQGDSWTPGNFGYLSFAGGTGAPETARYLADEGAVGCLPPIITTEPGQMTGQTSAAINTRFDIYEGPNPFSQQRIAWSDWPPAPNVIDYPEDVAFRPGAPRFGTGNWPRNSYFRDYHVWLGHGRPGGWNNMTRWEVYNWEILEGKLPVRDPALDNASGTCDTNAPNNVPRLPSTVCDGIPDPAHLNTGNYPPPRSIPERRVVNVAVVNCLAHGITGRETVPLFGNEGFAKVFLIRQASRPPDVSIFAEYIGWSNELEDNYHIDVQLYE